MCDSENSSFQNQITRRLLRKASQAAISAWKSLCAKKSSRGAPRAGVAKRSIQRASKFMRIDKEKDCSFYRGKCHERVAVSSRIYADLADTDARTLALSPIGSHITLVPYPLL